MQVVNLPRLVYQRSSVAWALGVADLASVLCCLWLFSAFYWYAAVLFYPGTNLHLDLCFSDVCFLAVCAIPAVCFTNVLLCLPIFFTKLNLLSLIPAPYHNSFFPAYTVSQPSYQNSSNQKEKAAPAHTNSLPPTLRGLCQN